MSILFCGSNREASEPSLELGLISREADLLRAFFSATKEEDEAPAPSGACRFFLTALVSRSVIGSLLTSRLVSLMIAGESLSSLDIFLPAPPPLRFSTSGVLLTNWNLSFAGEAGGEMNLTGGALRVNEWLSSALVCDCHGGVDTGLDTGLMGGGDAVKFLVEFMREDCRESKVGPSVKPAVLVEV